MWNYFEKQDFFIESLKITSQNLSLHGNGVLSWSPSTGFHLSAIFEKSRGRPTKTEIRAITTELLSFKVRMRINRNLRAFTTLFVPSNGIFLLENHLSIDLEKLVFSQNVTQDFVKEKWHGSGLYLSKSNLLLPDSVDTEVFIDGESYSQRFSRSGLKADESDLTLRGLIEDKKYVNVFWNLSKDLWSKGEDWHYAESFRNSLSMVAGEDIKLLKREVFRHQRIYTEVRKFEEPTSLGWFFRPFDYSVIEKDIVIHLSKFLNRGGLKSEICIRIFDQMVAASKQETQAGEELLLSTILEAALRTLYNQPLTPHGSKRGDPFKLNGSLKKFCSEYFPKGWTKIREKVYITQKHLRDRNAHPDWLIAPECNLSEVKANETVNEMIFLSRFYGYMIKALSGMDILKPEFPIPFEEWSPILTFTSIPDMGQGDKQGNAT